MQQCIKILLNLMFLDPCIILYFTLKIQQDATVYQNFIKLDVCSWIRASYYILYKKSDKMQECIKILLNLMILDPCIILYFTLKIQQDARAYQNFIKLDDPGSVHHIIFHIKNPTRCNSVSKFNFIFIWSSPCSGRHTAHHQEPKTALAASGFAYVEGCWPCSCWTLTASYTMMQGSTNIKFNETVYASLFICLILVAACLLL